MGGSKSSTENDQVRIVASITELNTVNQELKEKMERLEEEDEKLKTLLNSNGTNIIIEQTKRESELKKINKKFEKMVIDKERPPAYNEHSKQIEMPMSLFFGNQRDIHPNKYLAEFEKYLTLKKIEGEDDHCRKLIEGRARLPHGTP